MEKKIINISRLQELDSFGRKTAIYDLYLASIPSMADTSSTEINYCFFDNVNALGDYIEENKLDKTERIDALKRLDSDLNTLELRLSKITSTHAIATTIDEEGILFEVYENLDSEPLKTSRKIKQIEKFIERLEKKNK